MLMLSRSCSWAHAELDRQRRWQAGVHAPSPPLRFRTCRRPHQGRRTAGAAPACARMVGPPLHRGTAHLLALAHAGRGRRRPARGRLRRLELRERVRAAQLLPAETGPRGGGAAVTNLLGHLQRGREDAGCLLLAGVQLHAPTLAHHTREGPKWRAPDAGAPKAGNTAGARGSAERAVAATHPFVRRVVLHGLWRCRALDSGVLWSASVRVPSEAASGAAAGGLQAGSARSRKTHLCLSGCDGPGRYGGTTDIVRVSEVIITGGSPVASR
jgi:hypothetical protein